MRRANGADATSAARIAAALRPGIAAGRIGNEPTSSGIWSVSSRKRSGHLMDEKTPLAEAMIGLNEMVQSLTEAGFSRDEAIRFTAIWLAESQRQTPGTDGT